MNRKAVLGIVLMVFAGFVFAQSESDFEVIQNRDGKITITGYKGRRTGRIVIPSKLYGLDVTEIGDANNGGGVFSDGHEEDYRGIVSVVLPESLKKIGSYAFGNNAISNIVFPSSLEEIGERAFSSNRLTNINIPSTVKKIGGGAFSDNQIRNVTISDGITSIEREVFENNPLRNLVIPNSVASLGYCAFQGTQIRKLEIHGARKNIDDWVFGFRETSDSGIVAVIIDANAQYSNIIGEGFNNYYISQGRKAGIYIKRGPIWTTGTQEEYDAIEQNTFPSGFAGTWKRDDYNNTLTFTRNTLKANNQDFHWNLLSVADNVYEIQYSRSTAAGKFTIKLTDGKIEISGDSGTDENNWNGTWRKQ